MSDATQLIIPYAAAPAPACRQALQGLALPTLGRLLARLAPAGEDAGAEDALSPPHERALARALGLPAHDGRIPWAAWQLYEQGQDPGNGPWAWITPCHWVVGRDRITMQPPARLALTEAESRALMAAMQPYFEEDGLALSWDQPGRWLAQGELFQGLACASLDRVSGRDVDAWLPRGAEARGLRRLQQEMQMLLYTHPVNEAREQARQFTVNSFWASGIGALPQPVTARRPAGLQVEGRLRDAALDGDGTAWAAVWRQIDAQVLPRLLEAMDQGRPVTLTLCGEHHAHTWAHTSRGWRQRLSSLLRAPSVTAVLESL